MEHEATAHANEHPPTTIRQYVLIGAILTILTLIELWLSYSGLPHGPLIAALLVFSAIKFAIVVALFMHLRFDNRLFTRMFLFGLVLAGSLLLALLGLFSDNHDSRTVEAYATPGAVAAHEAAAEAGGHGEGEGGGQSGGGEAAGGATTEGGDGGDPAAGMVQGIPVAEFFQANCAVCHGQNREGLVGPALTPERLTQPDEFYHDTILNGRPGTAMPSWAATKGLNDADANALVQFLKHVEP